MDTGIKSSVTAATAYHNSQILLRGFVSQPLVGLCQICWHNNKHNRLAYYASMMLHIELKSCIDDTLKKRLVSVVSDG